MKPTPGKFEKITDVHVGDLFVDHDPNHFSCNPLVISGYDSEIRVGWDRKEAKEKKFLILNAEHFGQFSDLQGRYSRTGLMKLLNRRKMRKVTNVGKLVSGLLHSIVREDTLAHK